MTSDETQQAYAAKGVAKGNAILTKFYQILKDDATNVDDLITATIAMAPLLAYMIAKIHPGDRQAQLATANTIAEGVCELIERADPDATALQ